MKMIGIALLSLCAFFLVKEYTNEKSRRALEYSEIYRLISHIKTEVSDTGKSLGEALSGFYSNPFEESGFIEILKSSTGTNSHGWREKIEMSKLYIDGEDRLRIISFFSDFGKHGIEEELNRISEILSYFNLKQNSISEKTSKDIKVAWLLFATSFTSILIMIL